MSDNLARVARAFLNKKATIGQLRQAVKDAERTSMRGEREDRMFFEHDARVVQGSSAPQTSNRSPTGLGQWVWDRWVHTCQNCRLALWRERFETVTPTVEIPRLICRCAESPEIKEAFRKIRLQDEEAHRKWKAARTSEEVAEASRLLGEWESATRAADAALLEEDPVF